MMDFGELNKVMKISGKVYKLNSYNGFSGNISSFILVENFQSKHFFEFFYIQPFEEINKIIENRKLYKRRERVKRLEAGKK